MSRLEILTNAWRAAYCQVGGDPDAALWWNRWLDQFWMPAVVRRPDCDAVSSHHGLILWDETESGLIGVRSEGVDGCYLIPRDVRIAAQLLDDDWLASCEEERSDFRITLEGESNRFSDPVQMYAHRPAGDAPWINPRAA